MLDRLQEGRGKTGEDDSSSSGANREESIDSTRGIEGNVDEISNIV